MLLSPHLLESCLDVDSCSRGPVERIGRLVAATCLRLEERQERLRDEACPRSIHVVIRVGPSPRVEPVRLQDVQMVPARGIATYRSRRSSSICSGEAIHRQAPDSKSAAHGKSRGSIRVLIADDYWPLP